LDGDGKLEVVVTRMDLVAIFRNDGTLVAGWPRHFDGLADAVPTLVDLDGDGTVDILLNGSSLLSLGSTGPFLPYIHALHLDGSSLDGFPAFPEPIAGWFGPLSVGDVDGDGKLDIATVFNDGTGNGFIPRKLRLHVLDSHGRSKPRFPISIGRRPPWGGSRNDNAPLLADLDGDGILDVAVGQNKRLNVVARTGRRRRVPTRFKWPKYHKDPWDDLDPLVGADLNGDSRPELVVGTALYNFSRPIGAGPQGDVPWQQFLTIVTRGNGTLPGWPAQFVFEAGDQRYGTGAVAIGDIDGDGQREIVVGTGFCENAGAGYQCPGVLAFRPDGSVVDGFPKPTVSFGPSSNATPGLGDLDNNGRIDVVWLDSNGLLMVWEMPQGVASPDLPWPMARQNAAHTGTPSSP
jgi:hypothetical protein